MSTAERKQERLDVRLSAGHKRIIEKAAVASGQSVSSFAVSHLIDASRRVLEAQHNRVLSDKDRKVFLAILDRDSPNERLRQAATRFKKRHGR